MMTSAPPVTPDEARLASASEATLTPTEARAFADAWYSPRRMTMVITGDIDPVERAKADFVAAQAVLASGGEPKEAVDLARRARSGYQASERPSPNELAEIADRVRRSVG